MLRTKTIASGNESVATLRFTVAWRGESFSPSSLVMAAPNVFKSAAVIIWSESSTGRVIVRRALDRFQRRDQIADPHLINLRFVEIHLRRQIVIAGLGRLRRKNAGEHQALLLGVIAGVLFHIGLARL